MSYEKVSASPEMNLRVSPWHIIGAMLIAGMLMVSVSDRASNETARLSVLAVVILCYLAALLGWVFEAQQRDIGRWLLSVGIALAIHLGIFWLHIPEMATLLSVPVLVASSLLNVRAGFLVALFQSVLLLATRLIWAVDQPVLLFGLMAIWVVWGLLVTIHWPMQQIAVWSWQQYERVQNLLKETRARSSEMAQLLDDLMHANRQLDLLNERLAATRLLAEEAHKSKATFVAKVSHEFRTPLNMIIGLTDLLMETPDVYGERLPSALLEDLKIVHRNCTHLASMVNDVLDISQTEAGRLSLRREWVDLREDVAVSLEVVQPLLDKKKLALKLCLHEGVPQIYCDRTRIRQVLLNLVSNAARYTEQGSIQVEVTSQEQSVTVHVRDTGPGIHEADLVRIFEPFAQSANGVWRDRSGSGLGLTISRQFIELHGGSIWVESEVGKGSTFSFRLPVFPATRPIAPSNRWLSEEWMWLERSERTPIPKLPYRQRIVLQDASGERHDLFAEIEEEIEVVTATNLDGVEEVVNELPAHAVLVTASKMEQLWGDVSMARERLPDTPIIGYVMPVALEKELGSGVFDYLIKPVTRADLRKIILSASEFVQKEIVQVLIVDDDDDFRHLLARMLIALNAELVVKMAGDGAQALAILKEQPPDLIFLDISMPHMDGWQLLATKEQSEELRHIPVTIISAQDPTVTSEQSGMLLATIGDGLPPSKLARCTLALSNLLLKPDP